MKFLALAALILVVLIFAGCSVMKVKTIGSPFGLSVRTKDYIATLINTQQPYTPTLQRDPRNDRYGFQLLLTPLDGSAKTQLIPLTENLEVQQFRIGTRILGEDGNVLWVYAGELAGYDLKSGKRITRKDVSRANPSLDELWENGRYEIYDQHLRVLSHDYSHAYSIDPVTLKASPASEKLSTAADTLTAASFLSAGGPISVTKWMGVLSPAQVEREYKPGTRPSRSSRPGSPKELRKIYESRLDLTKSVPEIAGVAPVSTEEFLDAAFLNGSPDSGPLHLTGPDGFLLTYKSAGFPSGTLMVARMDDAGKLLWSADSGIAELEQVLPGVPSVALIGKRPMVPGKVQEPVLAILNTGSGQISVESLWQQ